MATMSLQAAYDQARSYLEANRVDQAIGVAQHILDQLPENLEAHRILGEAYLAGRQFDQSEAAFSRVLHADPENIPAHVGLGITFERQGKLDRAVTEFEQALEVRPDMPELRSQLLRLYTDIWGSEGATLRLSRPGLARLYAKGHMLPQAIQEFRSVIEEHPERFDARVGLAEALWRDGQEQAAVEICEEMLAERPDVLKANLLLGYIKLANSDAAGEPPWRLAQQLDPYQAVAHALFETMPDLPGAELQIAAWDEAAWTEQRDQAAARLYAAQAPTPAAVAPAVAAADDLFSDSWLDAAPEPLDQPTPAARIDADANGVADQDDDFLASLLALNTPALPMEQGSAIDSASGVVPFSFDDFGATSSSATELEPFALSELGLSDAEFASLGEPYTANPASDEPTLEPLSLADLGLTDDDLAQLDATTTEQEPAPFSLAELGLSEDEIAQLNAEVAPAPELDENPELTPFSLAELGLSDEDIALLEQAPSAEQAPAEPAFEPFSLEDLGLSPDEIAALEVAPPPAPPAAPAPPAEPGMADFDPFDWNSIDPAGTESASAQAPLDTYLDLDMSELQPFSLDDLDLNSLDDDDASFGGLPSALQPFSLDEPTPAPRSSSPTGDLPALDSDQAPEDGGAYSWQQPSAKRRTDFGRPEEPEAQRGSIFGKLRQAAAERPPEELPPLPPVSDDEAASAGYFSNDDVPLRPEDSGTGERLMSSFRLPKEAPRDGLPPAAVAAAAVMGASQQGPPPELTPFSLEDLGLSPDEIAALEVEQGATSSAPSFDAEPELTPFSLADLGLSPDEIAALEAAERGATPSAPSFDAEPELTPFSLADLGLSPDEIAALEVEQGATSSAPSFDAEPELTPFSLADLGLSPDEIAALEGTGEVEAALPATGDTIVPGWSQGEEPELTPFSLDDFGFDKVASPVSSAESELRDAGIEPFSLDDFNFDGDDSSDEVGGVHVEPFSLDALGLGEIEPPVIDPSRELSLSAEELAGLDLGEFEAIIADAPGGPPPAKDPAASFEQLMSMGQKRGYVDLTDIIAVVSDPEAEAERIEEIGWALHRAGIEIRDGDEIIDMMEEGDAEPDEALAESGGLELFSTPADASFGAEPELTPFSLADLGLSPDEIAALGLTEAGEPAPPPAPAPAAPPAPAAEPELTPFSLADLGLSPDEIAALGLTEASEPAPPAPVAPPAPAAEPELTPFSLADLGLSPDEIAALNLEQAAATPAPTPDDLFDFGLDDLAPVEKVTKRTEPRVEEPPPPVSTADTAFLAEPLDKLDDIWQLPLATPAPPVPAPPAPPKAAREEPARVVLPPPSERAPRREAPPREAAPSTRTRSDDDNGRRSSTRSSTRSRDDERFARREAIMGHPAGGARPPMPIKSFADFLPSGDEALDGYLRELDTEPGNYGLAMAIGRLSAQTGRPELMSLAYKGLIKDGQAINELAGELEELVGALADEPTQRQLYRLLGDAYSKQGRFREAMAAYSYTFGR